MYKSDNIKEINQTRALHESFNNYNLNEILNCSVNLIKELPINLPILLKLLNCYSNQITNFE